MSSVPLPCPCCPKCRAEAFPAAPLPQPQQVLIRHKLPTAPLSQTAFVPRRSTRILEKTYREFYKSNLDILDQFDSMRDDPKTYEVKVIQHLLAMTTRPNKEERKILIRIMFEFLSQNTHIIERHPNFRKTVLTKIEDIRNQVRVEPDSVNNQPLLDAARILYDSIEPEIRLKIYD